MIWSSLTCSLFGPGVPARSCHQLPGPHLLLEKLFSASLVKLVLGGELAASSEWTRQIHPGHDVSYCRLKSEKFVSLQNSCGVEKFQMKWPASKKSQNFRTLQTSPRIGMKDIFPHK